MNGTGRIKRMLLVAAVGSLFAILPSASASADPNASRYAPLDNLPNWSGTWATDPQSSMDGVLDCCAGPGTHVPLTPEFRKIRDDYVAKQVAEGPTAINNSQHCLPAGLPGVLFHPILFEFLFTPGRVTMIFDDGEIRRIYTDGRSHSAPEDLDLSYGGESVGHWENDTLVVDTVGIAPTADMFLSGGIKVTAETHVIERMHVTQDGQLHIDFSIEDPHIFSRPFSVTKRYQNVPGSFEVGCAANNRDLDDSIDLEPPF